MLPILKTLIPSAMLLLFVQIPTIAQDTTINRIYVSSNGAIGYERALFKYLYVGIEVNALVNLSYWKRSGFFAESRSRSGMRFLTLPKIRIPFHLKVIEIDLLPDAEMTLENKISLDELNLRVEVLYEHKLSNKFAIAAGYSALNTSWNIYYDEYFCSFLIGPIFKATLLF